MAATPILSFLNPLLPHEASRPFFLGVSGPQGSGKTTLVSTLASTLRSLPHNLRVVVLSIDDLYLPRTELCAASERNSLWRQRGLPGTHDIALGERVFAALKEGRETKIPSYDKSRFGGKGDRVEEGKWETVEAKVDVVIFEGWCVGFRAIGEDKVRERRLGWAQEELVMVDEALRGYDGLTDALDVFIHLDAEDLKYVYDWRLQQEHGLIKEKGQGMTDEQVVAFVGRYMPGYELYGENLRRGAMKDGKKQLRVVLGKNREVMNVEEV